MKKQLIIAAIACAVSGAAFAATTGSHGITLTVAPPPSQLALTGSLFGVDHTNPFQGTPSTNTTVRDWDHPTSLTTNADGTENVTFGGIGSVGVRGQGYPTTQTDKCVIYATGDWLLTGDGHSLKYGLYEGNIIRFGFATNKTTDTTERGETPETSSVFNNLDQGSCDRLATLDLKINDANRPPPKSVPDSNGSTSVQLTSLINFVVQVI